MTTLPASDESADRRIAQRFQPAFGTICRLDRTEGEDPIVGLVWNISRTGVSMLLADPPKCGTVMAGELTAETSGLGLSISLRVVHVRPVTTGDYLLGGQFTRPLESDEIKLFLSPPTPEPRERVGE